jgi:hypothetical protein
MAVVVPKRPRPRKTEAAGLMGTRSGPCASNDHCKECNNLETPASHICTPL